MFVFISLSTRYSYRGVNKDSIGGGGSKFFKYAREARRIFLPPLDFFLPHPPYKNIMMYIKLLVLVWLIHLHFAFSTHFWHLQTP